LRSGLTMTVAGAFAGIAASLGLSRLIASQLFGVQASDPLTIGVVLLLMVVAASAAAYLPARRAARVNPIVALRAQ
jgi:ABC-type antimicrobial peptide transport system permease subunit